MRKIEEVLRLKWACGRSHREIAASCKIGVGTVWDCLRRAQAAGVTWPLPEGISQAELERRLYPPPPALPAEQRPLPEWEGVARELKRKGVTLSLLWEEYRGSHPEGYGYSRFCELFQEWRGVTDPRMHQVHKAGEKLFVDYAGATLPVVDRKTGAQRQAQVFVATLGASSYTYAEATWTQTTTDWIGSHVRALAFFGGVPEIIVPDNLKAGVRSPCFYEPDVNRSYLEFARHYGVTILPARVRKPRDKAKVESGVQQVERRVLAPLRDHRWFALEDANEGLGAQLEELNRRPAPGLAAPRSELFATLDQPALRPLPPEPYQPSVWKKARVHLDYHVSVEDHCYSVPYRFLKCEVEVRLTPGIVEVYYQQERIASHLRCDRQYGYTTVVEHMPAHHRAWKERTPERFVAWAEQIGPATAAVVAELLASRVHPEHAYRACLGLLRLGQDHGAARLEAACRQGVALRAFTYQSVKAILTRNLQQPALPEAAETTPIEHANIRGAAYYDPER